WCRRGTGLRSPPWSKALEPGHDVVRGQQPVARGAHVGQGHPGARTLDDLVAQERNRLWIVQSEPLGLMLASELGRGEQQQPLHLAGCESHQRAAAGGDGAASSTPATIRWSTSSMLVSVMLRPPTMRPRFMTSTRSATAKMSSSRWLI